MLCGWIWWESEVSVQLAVTSEAALGQAADDAAAANGNPKKTKQQIKG